MRWSSEECLSRSGYVVVGIDAYHQQREEAGGYSESSNWDNRWILYHLRASMKIQVLEGRYVRWNEEVGRGIRFVDGILGMVETLVVEVQLFRSLVDANASMKAFGIGEMVFE